MITTYWIGWALVAMGIGMFAFNLVKIVWTSVKSLVLPFIVTLAGYILMKGAWGV